MAISRDLTFQHRFFEADGTTPVGVFTVYDNGTDPSPAPEPATYAGMGLGLLALAGYGRWIRQRS
jgi:MYXO-CTERM domain-containing protein